MSYITKSVTIIITLYSFTYVKSSRYPYEYPTNIREYTRSVVLKQGALQGIVVEPSNRDLPTVEVYRGIPYAAPPTVEFRYMPTKSSPSWMGTKYADTFGPVCPQQFPNDANMSMESKDRYRKLSKYLKNENEDCLYLNVYAPFQVAGVHTRKYPVMVFIHGESFEWNSGIPYDGSILAGYGEVVVVTLNFRLGILGFLQVETQSNPEQGIRNNFGLVDQIAALLWVKENIDAFGGDPDSVTLFGHGTGAVCVSLLTISPMVVQGNRRLFHRAILMSGTALADWALVSKPLDITYQVAEALKCRIQDGFAACLRSKSLDEIMSAKVATEPYKTRFGPVVDSLPVPNDPVDAMAHTNDIFKRFELMYGVTEQESINLPLGDVALTHGMLEKERTSELRKYLRSRCDSNVEMCLARTLEEYNCDEFGTDQEFKGYVGYNTDRAALVRDELLDILSDARTVAPVIQTGLYHSALHLQSYFYVFSHKTHSKEHIRNKSYHGEELPYVFGVPLDDKAYTEDEKLLSKTIMTYFTNFAYTGNPNMRDDYGSHNLRQWPEYDLEWPEFESTVKNYLQMDTPPSIGRAYRDKEVTYWNKYFPLIKDAEINPPPWIYYPPGRMENNTNRPPEGVKENINSSTVNVPMVAGGLFFVANVILFLVLYFKCFKNRRCGSRSKQDEVNSEPDAEKPELENDNNFVLNGCNIVKMISKSSRSDETYEAVRIEADSKSKLTRQLSNSTIDAHTKVRDWITNEIVYKYSPRYFRRQNRNNSKTKIPKQKKLERDVTDIPAEFEHAFDQTSTLGKSPTRPVSPSDGAMNTPKPLLIKTASIDSSKHRKRRDKVSVAVDATPAGRGPSVLMQQPIELTKSLDYPKISPTPLRRSVTLEDFSTRKIENELKSTNSMIFSCPDTEPTVIRIEHSHSKSDPVQDLNYSTVKKLKTFDPHGDVNVTSRDDEEKPNPLSPEESLLTIKRRNFPKVLPDYPGREALIQKRRSMPAHTMFHSIPEYNSESQGNLSLSRLPPAPPPRTTTLTKQSSNPQPVCVSEPMLAEEPPSSPEPEVTCNNLYVGPLLPKTSNTAKSKPQAIYESLRSLKETEGISEAKTTPKTVITANSNNPIKRIDPKVVVRPTIFRTKSDDKSNKKIPRVVVPDNQPFCVEHIKHQETQVQETSNEILKTNSGNTLVEISHTVGAQPTTKTKKSQIPTLVKSSNSSLNKDLSGSDSSPSEESDTGTVVKRS